MKKLYLIGGTMGVGKTTVSQTLKMQLENSVFLDGDWCWDAHSFQVTEETKEMVLQNICTILNNFLQCSEYIMCLLFFFDIVCMPCPRDRASSSRVMSHAAFKHDRKGF